MSLRAEGGTQMSEAKIRIALLLAHDDPEVASGEYQAEQRAFVQVLKAENIIFRYVDTQGRTQLLIQRRQSVLKPQ